MRAIKITTKNYFKIVDKIGIDNLPEVLRESHLVIGIKTARGVNWRLYHKDPELKRMVDLTFKKLEEFMASENIDLSGMEDINELQGVQQNENPKKGNPYSKISTEIKFIHRFLAFHDKILYKNTFEIFIDELQKAIQNKEITKKSPVAKDIIAMQNAVIGAFNAMKNAKHFVLKPETIKRYKSIIEKYENAYEDLEDEPKEKKVKRKSIGLNGINQSDGNIMNSIDFTNLEFNTIGFTDKWLAFIGDPAPGFTAMVYGKPKMGKSYLCVDFAGYLARNHGKVLYVAKEEKLDATLQKKLKDKDVANENLFVSDNLPEDLSEYQFVILDSVNKLGLNPEDLGTLKINNPGVCFIYVFQTTKEGKFRGTNEFQHDVDIVIEVPERGKAVQYGRFNQGGEMNIFEEAPIENAPAELSGIKKSKKKNSTTSNKKIEIEAEFGIPLEELALEVIKKGESKDDIVDICYKQEARVNAAAQRMADAYIKDAKAKVTLLKIKFRENDSHNLSHAASYFEIKLSGTEKELRKVASADEMFFYEWENEELDGLSTNSKHNLHTPNRSVMLDGTNKKSMKKTENKGDSPIKMVADINDPYTKKVIKNIWNAADKKKRAEILDSQGYSHKFIDWDFEDLTPAIMQLIITSSIDTPSQKPKQKIKDWTEPEWLNQSDWQNLKQIKKYYEAGDFEAAMNHASNCDTVIREEIPPEIWKAMGGQLTKTGEEKLKKAEASEKFKNRPDDLNPNYIFSLTATQLLSEALKDDFDINYLIRHELAARGQDKEGKWVGFDKAKEIHQIE